MEAVAGQNRTHLVRAVLLATFLAGVLVAGAIVLYQLTRTSSATAVHIPPTVTPAGLVERSGVRVVRVNTTGDGGLLDLRFQVVDADRAQTVHDAQPIMIDESTGAIIKDLFMGHMHSGPQKVGITYYLIYNNPGTIVHKGSLVTVQLGDARLPHVRVQG
jgi:hypothetical protein